MAASAVHEIEEAITKLSPAERDELAVWLDEHLQTSLDDRIKADFEAGRLDHILREALEDEKHGRTFPL